MLIFGGGGNDGCLIGRKTERKAPVTLPFLFLKGQVSFVGLTHGMTRWINE